MSKTIKAIDKEAVHRICSGQVVLNLATAVKELVENSLDAGATTVEVRLREYGSDLIEVSDNGSGVLPSNFEGLTAKHCTSKLQDFSDLVNVETFGFRGEALSSLCAVSGVSVVTKHASETVGSKLVFDNHGNITSVTPVARQVGTTVTVEELFKSLPVRQKEFHRNLKREYFKMIQLLSAYGLVSTNIRISCSNQTKKGGRSVIMSTHGCKSVRENIACIFGTKQLNSLLDIRKVLPDSEILEELKVAEEEADKFDLEGLISSCAHGQGRSSSDRQFFYINNRPCEPSKIMKSVNEVYHSFNMHQTPFVFLNITAARQTVDVNVTPDKRQIFLDHEKLLIATIKASLMSLYEKIPSTFQVNNIFSSSSQSKSSQSSDDASKTSSSQSSLLNKWRHSNDSGGSDVSTSKRKIENRISQPAKQMKLDDSFVATQVSQNSPEKTRPLKSPEISAEALPYTGTVDRPCQDALCDNESENNFNSSLSQTCDTTTFVSKDSMENSFSIEIMDPSSFKMKNQNLSDNVTTNGEKPTNSNNECDQSSKVNLKGSDLSGQLADAIFLSSFESKSLCLSDSSDADAEEATGRVIKCEESFEASLDEVESIQVTSESVSLDKVESMQVTSESASINENGAKVVCESKNYNGLEAVCESKNYNGLEAASESKGYNGLEAACESKKYNGLEAASESEESKKPKKNPQREIVICASVPNDTNSKKTVTVSNVSVESIKQALQQLKLEKSNEDEKSVSNKFHATIDPSKNELAENELKREISKDMFAKMEIIGQFNLGFIIVKLGSDLFMIDQHATDEKYNFETLQMNTTISNQKLVSPQTLELTAANESLLLDNMEVFKKNGFEFSIDENAAPMKKVKLTAIPISQNWHFGKDDIDELLFMLQDSSGSLCRPSRVRAMFASRACRMSVMIGTALSVAEMKRLVIHMGEIEQPWNCPHGRPTMRHLVNLALLR